jgi:hypothetical protein
MWTESRWRDGGSAFSAVVTSATLDAGLMGAIMSGNLSRVRMARGRFGWHHHLRWPLTKGILFVFALATTTSVWAQAQQTPQVNTDSVAALSRDVEQLKKWKENVDPKIERSALVGDIQKIATVIGIIIGGFWAYYNYFRGRIYSPHLELTSSGQYIEDNGAQFIIATFSLKNPGLSRVKIRQEGSIIEISLHDRQKYSAEEYGYEVDWKDILQYSVFKAHRWIEPGELIHETRMFAIPVSKFLAAKVALRIVCDKRFTKRIEWNSETIVSRQLPTSDVE